MATFNRYEGQSVSIEFVSADASTAASVTLKDANDITYTLAANERLILDTLTGTIDPASTTIVADFFADIDGDGVIDANELTVRFSYVISQFNGGPEGLPFPVGITPKVKSSGAAAVRVTGMGRVVKGQTEGLRPGWRESLTPGK
jgi:hypothetical protein